MAKVTAKQARRRLTQGKLMEALSSQLGVDTNVYTAAFRRMGIAEDVIKKLGNTNGAFSRMCPRGVVSAFPDNVYKMWCEERHFQLTSGEQAEKVTLTEILWVCHEMSLRAPFTEASQRLMTRLFEVCTERRFGEFDLSDDPRAKVLFDGAVSRMERVLAE